MIFAGSPATSFSFSVTAKGALIIAPSISDSERNVASPIYRAPNRTANIASVASTNEAKFGLLGRTVNFSVAMALSRQLSFRFCKWLG